MELSASSSPFSSDASLRPTFFELYAADKLGSSLKAALAYSLSVRVVMRGNDGRTPPRRSRPTQVVNSDCRYSLSDARMSLGC